MLLRVKDLALEIGGTSILRDIDLQFDAGQVLGIIGESGSGKSITALSIMQLLPKGAIAQGKIELDGIDLLTQSESRLCEIRGNDIGMVFQEPMTALNPLQTIGAQVAETVVVHQRCGRATAMRIAAETLQRVELPNSEFPLHRYPHELSGGQRQRVVIAMAIALRPRLLIADEPTTALDVTTQARILTLLQSLVREDGMSLMLISHDLAVVANIADHIAIMRNGAVVESAATSKLLSGMQHPYSQQLFAASSYVPDKQAAVLPSDGTTDWQDRVLLDVQGVSRDYRLPRKSLLQPRGVFRAVDRVSFTIHRGENVGLVGESGCGKSTLTRAVLGLEACQQGSITIAGQPVLAGSIMPRSLRSRMQVVFQDPYGSFNPRHRVARLISEPLYLLDDAVIGVERRRLVQQTLESVGLQASDANKYIHEFSGGQRQRIAIARALIIRPDLMVLDEAVSALDVSIRAQILDLLVDLSDRYRLSYLFISHDLSVVRSVCDRVLVMRAGRIVEQGSTEGVFNDPQHSYTRQLVGAVPRLPVINLAV